MPARSRTSRAYQLAADPESDVRIAPSGRRFESSWKISCGLTGSAGSCARSLDHLPPLADVLFDLLPPAAVVLALQQRQQRFEGQRAVADEVDLHRVADAEHPAVEVDLHAARLALLRQELRVGEAGADHQQRVAVLHQSQLGRVPEQPDRAGDERQVVGHGCLAEQRLGDAGAEHVGDLDHLSVACSAPAPTSIATRSPALSTSAARRSCSSAGVTCGGV